MDTQYRKDAKHVPQCRGMKRRPGPERDVQVGGFRGGGEVDALPAPVDGLLTSGEKAYSKQMSGMMENMSGMTGKGMMMDADTQKQMGRMRKQL